MPVSPVGTGDGRPQTWTFTTDSGIFTLFGLMGSNIAMHYVDINTNTLYVCTGTWAITGDGSAGKAVFTPSAADLLVANPLGKAGMYKAYPVVTLSSGAVQMDSQLVEVESRP